VLNRPYKKADRALIQEMRKSVGRVESKTRVIQADAEITIHGSDRMSIRLFRKGSGGKANARAE